MPMNHTIVWPDHRCALAGRGPVLATGPHNAQACFRHDVGQHSPAVAAQIVGWHTVDHPSAGEVVKAGRVFFVRRRELVATPRLA